MLHILSDDEIYEIHVASLEILERTGIVVQDHQGLKILEDSGAVVNHNRSLVRIPPYLVEECIKKAPKSFVLGARNSSYDLHVKKGHVFTRPGSGYTHILDLETGEFRLGTYQDCVDATNLVDALKDISFCATHIQPSDVPAQMADTYAVKAVLENTEKHVFFSPLSYKNLHYIIKMALEIRGSEDEFMKRPLVSFIAAPTSPLEISTEVVQQVFGCTRYRVPIMLDSSPMCGATGPITLSGSVALQNAENMALNVLIQLTAPNTPVIYGPRSGPLDMRTGVPVWGSVEFSLLTVAGVQMGHYYGLPCDAHGPTTNSKLPDIQAGYEKALCCMMPALAGAEIVSGAGAMETLSTASFEQLVLDEEFYGLMFRVIDGLRVDDDALALKIVDKVGPGGNFLAEKHSKQNYLKEHHLTRLFDTRSRDDWTRAGAKDIRSIARERVKGILAEHRPSPLEPEVATMVDNILKEAQKEILGSGG